MRIEIDDRVVLVHFGHRTGSVLSVGDAIPGCAAGHDLLTIRGCTPHSTSGVSPPAVRFLTKPFLVPDGATPLAAPVRVGRDRFGRRRQRPRSALGACDRSRCSIVRALRRSGRPVHPLVIIHGRASVARRISAMDGSGMCIQKNNASRRSHPAPSTNQSVVMPPQSFGEG